MAPLRWTLMLSALLLVAVGPAVAGWSPLGGPGVPFAELQLDRGSPDLLYVNADSHLWRSDDAGATWRSLQAGLGRAVTAFALDPANRGTIWARTSKDQLWRSRDAGETWSQRPTPPSQFPRVIQLLVDSVDPETLYRVDESHNEDFEPGLRLWVHRSRRRSPEGLPRVARRRPQFARVPALALRVQRRRRELVATPSDAGGGRGVSGRQHRVRRQQRLQQCRWPSGAWLLDEQRRGAHLEVAGRRHLRWRPEPRLRSATQPRCGRRLAARRPGSWAGLCGGGRPRPLP